MAKYQHEDCECARCAGQTFEQYQCEMGQVIKQAGHCLQGVFPLPGDADQEYFIYTIGLYERGWPELLMISPPDLNLGGRLMNAVVAKFRKKERVELGKLSLDGEYPVEIREVDQLEFVKDEYTCQVEGYYGTRDYKVLQVLLPDTKGVVGPKAEIPFSARLL